MIVNRVLPVLPFVISSLVISSILRAPHFFDLYVYRNSLESPKLVSEAAVTNLTTVTPSRPPLSSLIADSRKKYIRQRNQTVIGDPQFLLDFAIIGYPKCGTSSMSALLGAHPEVQIWPKEMQHLSYSKPADAIWHLYTKLEEGNYKRGYKSPFDITNRLSHGRNLSAMDYIREYFPKTKLIVGVRHPIRWFESFYNFRLQRNVSIPPPYALIKRQSFGFGVKEANFHIHLARMGKVNMTSPQQVRLRKRFSKQLQNLPERMPNDVFFYDMEQLADDNATRSEQFRKDLIAFVGLQEKQLPPMVQKNAGKVKPAPSERSYIDICDSEYDKLRAKLLKVSRRTSKWIRLYWLDADDVYYSSRDYLEATFQSWMYDPCDALNKSIS